MTDQLLDVRNLTVAYRRRGAAEVIAIDDLSFGLSAGRTLGVIGESGSGKSTAARAVMQLERPRTGSVVFRGEDLSRMRGRALRTARRGMQMVFQDPFGSFNPKVTVGDSLTEPLLVHRIGDTTSRRDKVAELVTAVGLPASVLTRYPASLSGGQLQRLNIARALSVDPDVVVADEPTSALDVSIQAQIVNLLIRVQREFGVTYLFISHDLPLVSLLADDVVVLFRGHLVESGPTARVFGAPAHPYTRELAAAVPAATPAEEVARRRARDRAPTVPLPDRDPGAAGCPFVTRCPHREVICFELPPPIMPLEIGHSAACHFADRIQREPVVTEPPAVDGTADALHETRR